MPQDIKDMIVGPPIADGLFEAPSKEELVYAKFLSILARPSARFWFTIRMARLVYYIFVVLTLSWFARQFIDRHDPVTIASEVAEPEQVVAGSPVHIRIRLMRHKACDVTLKWVIVDSKRSIFHFEPLTTFPPGPAGPDNYLFPYRTDPDMAPGPATLLIHKEFRCPGNYISGIWPIPMDSAPIPFEVVSIRPPPVLPQFDPTTLHDRQSPYP